MGQETKQGEMSSSREGGALVSVAREQMKEIES